MWGMSQSKLLKGATIFLHGDEAAGIFTTTLDIADIDFDLGILDEVDWQDTVDELRARLEALGRFFDPPGGVTVLIVGWDIAGDDAEGEGPSDEEEKDRHEDLLTVARAGIRETVRSQPITASAAGRGSSRSSS